MKNPLLLLSSTVLALLAGCTTPHSGIISAPLAETFVDLSRTGRIGVVAFSSAPQANLVMPLSKAEAAREATDAIRFMRRGEFSALAHEMALVPGGGLAVLGAPLLFPLVAVVGGSVDAAQSWLRAEAGAELAASRAILDPVTTSVRLETQVRDQVLAALRGETRHPITVIADATLHRLDPRLAERAWRNDAGLGAKARQALAAQGLERLLEIRVHAAGLTACTPLGSDLAFGAQVRVRMVSLPDGYELYRRETHHTSAPRSARAWAADRGALLHAEVARCVATASATGVAGLARRDGPRPVRPHQLAALTP